jgi:hypothetical protein
MSTTSGQFSSLKTGTQASIQSFKYHYIREQIDAGLVEIKFARSEENLADLFTKNLKGETDEYHSNKLLSDG